MFRTYIKLWNAWHKTRFFKNVYSASKQPKRSDETSCWIEKIRIDKMWSIAKKEDVKARQFLKISTLFTESHDSVSLLNNHICSLKSLKMVWFTHCSSLANISLIIKMKEYQTVDEIKQWQQSIFSF